MVQTQITRVLRKVDDSQILKKHSDGEHVIEFVIIKSRSIKGYNRMTTSMDIPEEFRDETREKSLEL